VTLTKPGGLIATAASLVFCYATAIPLAKPATIVPGQGMVRGFLRDREIYPDAWRRWWLRDRPVAGAGQFRSAPVPSERGSNRLFLCGVLPRRAPLRLSRHS